MTERRPYRREAEDTRREALISAALDLLAQGGPQAATVRAIADRAGVTPGLIRHYFSSKDELTHEAYRHLMIRMVDVSASKLTSDLVDPVARLSAFVASALRAPVVDPVTAGLWAGFLQHVRTDPRLRDIHAVTYLAFRDMLQSLIAALPRPVPPEQLRRDAIACNGVLDGLWLEGSVLPEAFAPGELESIGLASVGLLLGVDLLPAPKETAP